MNEDQIIQYITSTFAGIKTVSAMAATFFSNDPEGKFPFTTLVTNDEHDQASNLNRPSVYRLNIGISKQTFRTLFGLPTPPAGTGDAANSQYDFTALDILMPHPVYGRMYWVCVLNPSPATFQEVVQPLLAEAYGITVKKYTKPVDPA